MDPSGPAQWAKFQSTMEVNESLISEARVSWVTKQKSSKASVWSTVLRVSRPLSDGLVGGLARSDESHAVRAEVRAEVGCLVKASAAHLAHARSPLPLAAPFVPKL